MTCSRLFTNYKGKTRLNCTNGQAGKCTLLLNILLVYSFVILAKQSFASSFASVILWLITPG